MRTTSVTNRLCLGALGAAASLLLFLPAAEGARGIEPMQSTKLAPGLCETTGGGEFVDIPWFPGEMIDVRLLADVRLLIRRYGIFVTDGYSLDPVHSANGEHPIGLGLDIIPDFSQTKRWRLISRLARFAEPKQNAPRPPFRWVGYNGDANHGKGHHLHLSWSHSTTKYDKPAETVYTLRCPRGADAVPPKGPAPEPSNGSGGTVPDTDENDHGDGGVGRRPRRSLPEPARDLAGDRGRRVRRRRRSLSLRCHNAPAGRVAQWESARFTRERSQVRNPPRPFPGPIERAAASCHGSNPARMISRR